MVEMRKKPRASWRRPFAVALLLYYFVMAAVGLLVSDEFLASQPWARGFGDFMASVIPQIDRVTALDVEPDVNRFYFSALWAGKLLVLALSLVLVLRRASRLVSAGRLWLLEVLMALPVLALLFASSQMLWAVESSAHLTALLFENDFGRSFLAQLVFSTGPVFGVACVVLWILERYAQPDAFDYEASAAQGEEDTANAGKDPAAEAGASFVVDAIELGFAFPPSEAERARASPEDRTI